MTAHAWQLTGTLERYFGRVNRGPIEHWPAELLREYQAASLAEQLAHVAANSPFYRRKFAAAGVSPADFRALEDLTRFPFTAKDELRGDPWILLSVPKDEVRLAHTSTGTTGGDWSYILYTWDDMHAHDVACSARLLMPVERGDVVVNALPYEMSSSGQSFQRSLQAGSEALVVPVGKGGFYSDPYKTVKIVADLGAAVLITTPPYAMLLAEVAADRGLRPGEDVRLRFIWLTGEGCSPAYRRRIEDLWQTTGLVFYGSMECGSIGMECPQKSGSHLSLGQVYVEIVEPQSGRPLPPGEVGEVVCTVLHRRASPLIRFRTQDLGMLDERPCPCGVRFPKLHIRGRMADQVSAVAGDASRPPEPPISPYAIEEVLFAQPEMGHNYQIYTDGGKLIIEAEFRAAEGETAVARQRIETALRERGLVCEVRAVEHIPRAGGKTRRVRPLAERAEVMRQPSLLRRE